MCYEEEINYLNKKFHKYFDTINTIYFPQKIMAMNLEIIFLTRGGVGKSLHSFKSLQISTRGKGGSKSPKSCLRRKWMTPYNVIS